MVLYVIRLHPLPPVPTIFTHHRHFYSYVIFSQKKVSQKSGQWSGSVWSVYLSVWDSLIRDHFESNSSARKLWAHQNLTRGHFSLGMFDQSFRSGMVWAEVILLWDGLSRGHFGLGWSWKSSYWSVMVWAEVIWVSDGLSGDHFWSVMVWVDVILIWDGLNRGHFGLGWSEQRSFWPGMVLEEFILVCDGLSRRHFGLGLSE